nr:hypothetical protein [Tanacetum cinerariifolium]
MLLFIQIQALLKNKIIKMLYSNMNLIWILSMMIQTSIMVTKQGCKKQPINDEDMKDEEDVDEEEDADDEEDDEVNDNAELEEDDANNGYDEDEDDE